MPEEKKQFSWKDKFAANRMAFESILFEKELIIPKREKLSTGLLGAAGIWLIGVILLWQWVLRRGSFFSAADAIGFERINAYAAHLSAGGFWSLFKPILSGLGPDSHPPLYYISYFPVLKFLTSDPLSAMLMVNSAYLLIIALAVFLAVKRSRNNMSGWLGTAFAFGMPFVLETARHPEPVLGAMAMAAAAYCCYINSDDFERPNWGLWCAVFFSLGFFAHRHFWVFALPLIPYFMAALAGHAVRSELLKGLLPGLALSFPWYVLFLAYRFSGLFRPESQSVSFWTYFGLSVQAASLPFFVVGALALLWMYYSVFIPYPGKKMVAAWFWVPYLALTYLVRSGDPKLIYPALLPFAVATAVMAPNMVRKHLLGAAVWLTVITQSGLVGTFGFGRYPIAGLETPSRWNYHAEEILEILGGAGDGPARVLVAGGEGSFNAGSFKVFSAAEHGRGAENLIFYNPAELTASFADYIILRIPENSVRTTGNGPSSILSEPGFGVIFEKKGEFPLKDTSSILVYAKRRLADKPFAEGTYKLRNYAIGGFSFEDAELTLGEFDPRKGVYSTVRVFVPCASYKSSDIYGLTLELTDFRAASSGGGISGLIFAGAGAVKVVSAKINVYALERFLADHLKFRTVPELTLGRTIGVDIPGPRAISAEFAAAIENGSVLRITPLDFEFSGYRLPDFITRNFAVAYDLSRGPYGLSFKTFKTGGQMIEIGSEEGSYDKKVKKTKGRKTKKRRGGK